MALYSGTFAVLNPVTGSLSVTTQAVTGTISFIDPTAIFDAALNTLTDASGNSITN